MEYLLKTPMSDDDKKIFRTELKRCGIKIKEEFEKILTKYELTDEQLKNLNLDVIPVFKNNIQDNISQGCSMLIDNEKLIWDR